MSRRVAVVGLAAGLALVPLSGAAASGGGRSRSVQVDGTGVSDASAPIGLSCDSTSRCLVSTLIPGSISGDVMGVTTARGASYANLRTGDYFGNSVLTIAGAVDGCGEGSFTVSLADFSGNLALSAPATGVWSYLVRARVRSKASRGGRASCLRRLRQGRARTRTG